MTPEQVLEIARQALMEGRGNPAAYQAWCVRIDGQPVAPKWLVSQLTGLPVSVFHSDEACRLLRQLDIEIIRA